MSTVLRIVNSKLDVTSPSITSNLTL